MSKRNRNRDIFGHQEIYLGKDEYSHIAAEIKEDGKIRGFNEYSETKLYSDEVVLHHHGWTHNVEIGKKSYTSGKKLPKSFKEPEIKTDADYICSSVAFCDSCGTGHDTEEYGSDHSFVLVECSVLCKECAGASDLLIPLEDPEDLFKAHDVQSVDTNGYEEVATLFCDSSGVGADHERALSKSQATDRTQEIIDNYKDEELFIGLTGIGQFQVYVTIYKKV